MVNQKAPNQNRSWILTLPAGEYIQEEVIDKLKSYTFVGQMEKGESGYLHWQLYIENSFPIKFTTLKNKFPKGHFEPRRGTKKQAYDYVTKSKTRVPDTHISRGVIDTTGSKPSKSSLEAVVEQMQGGTRLEELIVSEPVTAHNMRYLEKVEERLDKERNAHHFRNIKVNYLYGESGTGKTRKLYDHYGFEDLYRVTNYRNPFDTYSGESVLVLDEFYESLEFSYLLHVLDGHPMQLRARYSDKWAAFDTVWIVSNLKLENQFQKVRVNSEVQYIPFLRRIKDNYEMKNGEMRRDNFFLDSWINPQAR